MKKKLLIIFIGLIIVILGVAVLGYNYFFGASDEIRAQLREEFHDDFFSFQDIDFEHTILKEKLKGVQGQEKNVSTEELISMQYAAKLERLEEAVEDKINAIFENAYREYQEKIATNQLNQAQLARKYIQAGSMLEEAVDILFEEIIKEMEIELQESQLSTDLANEARAAYNAMIKQRKADIMQQIEKIR